MKNVKCGMRISPCSDESADASGLRIVSNIGRLRPGSGSGIGAVLGDRGGFELTQRRGERGGVSVKLDHIPGISCKAPSL